MRVHGRPETAARHALWLGGLLVVLAGLFGMHGLDSHGAAPMDTIPHAVMSSTDLDGHAPSADEGVAHQALEAAQTGTGAAALSAAGGMDMAMVGMCLAVLAVALIMLVPLLRDSPTRPFLWMTARPARAPGNPGRAPPPLLIDLSIQRC